MIIERVLLPFFHYSWFLGFPSSLWALSVTSKNTLSSFPSVILMHTSPAPEKSPGSPYIPPYVGAFGSHPTYCSVLGFRIDLRPTPGVRKAE